MKMEEDTKVNSIETMVEEYMKIWTEKERIAYNIAKSHLQSSFQLEKSNGFLQWKKQQNMLYTTTA
jgi:hypothetical protein